MRGIVPGGISPRSPLAPIGDTRSSRKRIPTPARVAGLPALPIADDLKDAVSEVLLAEVEVPEA